MEIKFSRKVFTLFRMAKMKSQIINNVSENINKLNSLYSACCDVKCCNCFGNQAGSSTYKTPIPSNNSYLVKGKKYVCTTTCTLLFTAAQNQKLLICYLAIKRNEVLIHAITCVNLKTNMWKNSYIISLIRNSKLRKSIKTESRLVLLKTGRGLVHDERTKELKELFAICWQRFV